MVDCRHGRGICPSESGRAEYFTILLTPLCQKTKSNKIPRFRDEFFRKIEAILEHFKFINQGPIWFSSVDRQIRGLYKDCGPYTKGYFEAEKEIVSKMDRETGIKESRVERELNYDA